MNDMFDWLCLPEIITELCAKLGWWWGSSVVDVVAEVETRAAMLLTFELGRLLGFDDCNKLSSVEQDIFRLLTPLAKLYTAKQVSFVMGVL